MQPNDWFIDSACTDNMTGNQKLFESLTQEGRGLKVSVANDEHLVSVGSGSVPINLAVDTSVERISKVLCVPGLSAHLLSVTQQVESGNSVIFDSSGCRILDTPTVKANYPLLATASKVDGLYKLDVKGGHVLETESTGEAKAFLCLLIQCTEGWVTLTCIP